MLTLLIDGGQSGCRAALVRDGVTQRTLSGPGLARQGRDYGMLRSLVEDRVDVVAAGLTGFAGEADVVRAALGAPAAVVTDDAVTAHLGALGGEPGVVVVAGTGAIALAGGAGGSWARADGWGTRLGDDGGGYWIGRRGLALALRARDGRGGSPALLARAEARLGPNLVAAVYDAPDPVAVIAAFARDVAATDDPAAARIWADAGAELARTAAAALGKADCPRLCSWAGGVFAAGELVLGPFAAELARLVPGVEIRPPLGSGLDGAARLLERPSLFNDLIYEARGGAS